MRPTRVLLMVSTAAGALSVVTALTSAERAAMQYGLAASAALIGYVLLAGPALPRVRPALAAGIALFAAPMTVELWWFPERPADVRWFTPFYAPLGGGLPPTGQVQIPATLLDQWRLLIDQERLRAFALLLGVLCLAVAVVVLPVRQRPKATRLAGVVAVLLLAVVGANAWSRIDDAPPLGLLEAVWPALLATLLAAGVVALSGARADRAALVPLGALLVAVTVAVTADDLASSWFTWWTFSNRSDHSTQSGTVVTSAVGTVASSTAGSADVSAAVRAAVALAGPALLTVGALAASREAATA
ncbi:hypothetical protein ACGF7U_14280 [Micromonospora sp. NPDC047670]|uniref:hypothetical protein n=1 Tax=Micromonospora sp. NPDC047670 TaxID=3364252 RepID=UPI00371CDB7D